METSKKFEYPTITAKDWREEAISDHLNCCLCGSELHFTHNVDHKTQVAVEAGCCEFCGVKHHARDHRLQ